MKLINKFLRFIAKSFLNFSGCLLVFIFLLFSVTSCQKADSLKSKNFVSFVNPDTPHFLLNFGLDLKSNLVSDGFVLHNLYATKVVVFNISVFNQTTSYNELKAMVDKGTNVVTTPYINMEYYFNSINYCLGISVNGDYYLLIIDETSPTFIINNEGNVTFNAMVSGRYKK